MTCVTAYVGLGSNLVRPREQVLAALDELDRLPQTHLVSHSRIYRSAPLGHEAQPDFVNAVARFDTELEPHRLLAELQAIEKRHGRERSFPDAPRTLDLDLLLYGDAVITSASLIVPHPRMHQRAFVLRPLAEICPSVSIPGRGTAEQLLRACAPQDVEPMA
ncbi:MAG: 2-amino-4-hydroxy-6-hydroxymethyldihydropteridine diphosphokinase [Burkholderiales bacterium]